LVQKTVIVQSCIIIGPFLWLYGAVDCAGSIAALLGNSSLPDYIAFCRNGCFFVSVTLYRNGRFINNTAKSIFAGYDNMLCSVGKNGIVFSYWVSPVNNRIANQTG
jgi:hypothetical protein